MENTPIQPSATLFVADIPSNVVLEEFIAIFRAQEGFKSARLRKDRNSHTVGFADFEDAESASFAMETLQGYKWSKDDHGITIHFSHNSTTAHPRTNGTHSPQKMGSNRSAEGTSMMPPREMPRTSPPSVSFMPDLVSPFQQSHPPQQSTSLTHPNYAYPTIFPNLPSDATSSLYVEGLPPDATEREVAHIFRPFPGYQSLRILTKESKQNPSRVYNLCFVEFDNKFQATFALNHLQGYRLDKDDVKGLTVSYAKTERKPRQQANNKTKLLRTE